MGYLRDQFLWAGVHCREMYGKGFPNKTITAVVGGGIAEREPGWPQAPV
jgi:hypothetical protein